jgi:lipoate-protein ligase A
MSIQGGRTKPQRAAFPDDRTAQRSLDRALASDVMGDAFVHIVKSHLTGDAPLDTAVSRVILEQVSDGDLPETLQIGCPHRVVAFGRHDAITPGFDRAVAIAVDRGFDPTIRLAGGRAVVFHEQVIRFAWTVPTPDPVRDMRARFEAVTNSVIDTLRSFDVTGTAGELPHEYCPGNYSVSVHGAGKVMGSGQRLARRAAQIAGMIVVKDGASINMVLEPVYRSLGLDMDPKLTGAVADVANVNTSSVMDRFSQQIVGNRDPVEAGISDETSARASGFRADHDPRVFA